MTAESMREEIARIVDPAAFDAFSTRDIFWLMRERKEALAKADDILSLVAETEVARIMSMSDDEVLAEVRAEGLDPEVVAEEMRQAILSRLSPAPAEGMGDWVRVPREPTAEIVAAIAVQTQDGSEADYAVAQEAAKLLPNLPLSAPGAADAPDILAEIARDYRAAVYAGQAIVREASPSTGGRELDFFLSRRLAKVPYAQGTFVVGFVIEPDGSPFASDLDALSAALAEVRQALAAPSPLSGEVVEALRKIANGKVIHGGPITDGAGGQDDYVETEVRPWTAAEAAEIAQTALSSLQGSGE